MTILTPDEIASRFASLQVGPHREYPTSGQLTLLPATDASRFWLVPRSSGRAAYIVDALLRGIGDPDHAILFPRSGHWPVVIDRSPPSQRVQMTLLASLGVPPGHVGGIRCDGRDTIRAAVAAWQVDCVQDLYLLPIDGKTLVNVTHSGTLIVECRDEPSLASVVRFMQECGIELPDDVPDASFKRPAWMPRSHPASPRPSPR